MSLNLELRQQAVAALFSVKVSLGLVFFSWLVMSIFAELLYGCVLVGVVARF
jgi:hypothetical protein